MSQDITKVRNNIWTEKRYRQLREMFLERKIKQT